METVLMYTAIILSLILLPCIYLRNNGSNYGREVYIRLFAYRKPIIMVCPCFLLPPIKAIKTLVSKGYVVVITYKQTKEYPVNISDKELKRMFKIFPFMGYLILWGIQDGN